MRLAHIKLRPLRIEDTFEVVEGVTVWHPYGWFARIVLEEVTGPEFGELVDLMRGTRSVRFYDGTPQTYDHGEKAAWIKCTTVSVSTRSCAAVLSAIPGSCLSWVAVWSRSSSLSFRSVARGRGRNIPPFGFTAGAVSSFVGYTVSNAEAIYSCPIGCLWRHRTACAAFCRSGRIVSGLRITNKIMERDFDASVGTGRRLNRDETAAVA